MVIVFSKNFKNILEPRPIENRKRFQIYPPYFQYKYRR